MKIHCKIMFLVLVGLLLYAAGGFAEGGYESITFWGTWGTGPGQFRYPHGVCVDHLGYIYVCDGGYSPPPISNHRVQKFASDGSYVLEWGGQGSGDGQFQHRLQGIATDSEYVYVTDHDNHRIQKFTLDGVFVAKWGSHGTGIGQFISLHGIAIDSDNYLYVVDDVNDRVTKYTSDGTLVNHWTVSGSPRIPACDGNGHVYISDHLSHVVRKYDTSGSYIMSWGSYGTGDGQFSYPYGVACDKYGYVYVCDQHNHRIQKFTSDGDFVTKWGSAGPGPGQLSGPNCITVDGDGNVIVSEQDGSRVQIFGIAPLSATVDIDPDVLNDKSEGIWVTCYIELPEGYSVADIDTTTVEMTEADGDAFDPPLHREGPVGIGDHDQDSIPDLMVKFDRQDLIAQLIQMGKTSFVELTVQGELDDGTVFEGSDVIMFLYEGQAGWGHGQLTQGESPVEFMILGCEPNPFKSRTTVTYAIPSPAYAVMTIYDASGRMVKVLEKDYFQPGYHMVSWDGVNEHGGIVPNGVYFIRFETNEYKATQKLLFVK